MHSVGAERAFPPSPFVDFSLRGEWIKWKGDLERENRTNSMHAFVMQCVFVSSDICKFQNWVFMPDFASWKLGFSCLKLVSSNYRYFVSVWL